MLKRFPVTLTLAIQYGALVLYPASHDDNPYRTFVYQLTIAGLVVACLTELVLYRFKPNWGTVRSIAPHRAGLIAVSGALLQVIGLRLGLGVYGYGYATGLTRISKVADLLTPFHVWPFVGIILLLYSWRRQESDRKLIAGYTLATIAIEVYVAFAQSTLASLYQLFLVIGVTAVLAGVVRLRVVLVLLAVLLVTWPTIYQIRNEGRIAKGATGVATATANDAYHRIDFDYLMAQAKLAKEENFRVAGIPSFATVISEGFLPRFLDPGRPVLQTSELINVALGGTAQSSTTMTTFGEVWFLYGWDGFVIIMVLSTAAAALLTRHRGPAALVGLGIVVLTLLAAESTFPDAIAATIDYSISAAIALLVLRPVRPRAGT